MNLADLLSEETVKLDLKATTKDEAIAELVDIMVKAGKILPQDCDGVIRAVREREEVMTTGVGSGISFPHAKSELVPELMLAVAFSRKGVAFGSIDGQPAHLFFLLLSREDTTGPHIQALARLARLLRDEKFRQELMQAKDSGEVLQIIANKEVEHNTLR